MDNGDNLTKCYSEETIECICISLLRWKDVSYTSIEEVLNTFHIKFKEYKDTDFRNGYKSLNKVPRFIIENKGVTAGIGKEEWGFYNTYPMFIINHGKILEQFNIK